MSATPAPGPSDRPEWFYLHNRQKAGPFSLAQLRRLLEAGELQPDDLVLRQGAEVWAAVSTVPDLTPPAWQPTPPPGITTTPGLAPAAAPAPDDWPAPAPKVKRSGFWHWYRTHPGLVALLVAGVLLLMAIPVLTVLIMYNRQVQMARAMEAQVMQAEAQARRAEALMEVQWEREIAQDRLVELRQQYADKIHKAHQAWKNNNLAAAREHLDGTEKELRGWEHRYLRRLLSIGQGAQLCRTLPEHDSPVHAVTFSPDSRLLASADGSEEIPGVVRLWDMDGKAEPRLLKGHTGWVSCLAFSPDGKRLATGSSDRSIKVWNVQPGEVEQSLTGHKSLVSSVAFSPDGKALVSVDGQTLKIWDVLTGEESNRLVEQQGPYQEVAFGADRLAAMRNDGIVVLWFWANGDFRSVSGRFLEEPPFPSMRLGFAGGRVALASGENLWISTQVTDDEPKRLRDWKGHQSAIRAIALIPDATRLVTGADDRTIRLWDPFIGKELLTLTGHSAAVTSLAFSPDGKRLVSGSADRTVKVWEAAPADK